MVNVVLSLYGGFFMLKKIIGACLLLAIMCFQAAAQEGDAKKVSITGDLLTIYTLGNANEDQRIDTVPDTAGAFFYNPLTGTRKNGFYTAANLYATIKPAEWLEGYFKLYSIHRPGSFYMPLQMENLGREDFSTVKLDAVYGKASVLEAVGLNPPVYLFLKGGRYKAQAAQYGIISKYKTEQVLYMMNTKTDLTYEMEFGVKEPFKLGLSGATNYLLNQSVQRLYDEDGAFSHGNDVINEYAPQFLLALRFTDFSPSDSLKINAELLYGQNVSNIYSGNAIGASAGIVLDITDDISVPIGLQFGFFEKNIDLLGQAALTPMTTSPAAGGGTTTDFRESYAFALGAGLRVKTDIVNVEFNLAGNYNFIKHFYRTDLSIIKLSADAMITLLDKFFAGGGLILGSLSDAEWKTRDGVTDDDYSHVFKLSENMGYELYGGINLGNSSKFVVGFNQNKGISLNNMLEAKLEGQMKFKQEDSNWGTDKLVEAGGLYFKFFFKF
jgi:hypothetical protein